MNESNDRPNRPTAQPSFKALKRRNDHGAEHTSARELQPLLGYSQWLRFEEAVGRAQTACEQWGNKAGHHFAGAGKMVETGNVTPPMRRPGACRGPGRLKSSPVARPPARSSDRDPGLRRDDDRRSLRLFACHTPQKILLSYTNLSGS